VPVQKMPIVPSPLHLAPPPPPPGPVQHPTGPGSRPSTDPTDALYSGLSDFFAQATLDQSLATRATSVNWRNFPTHPSACEKIDTETARSWRFPFLRGIPVHRPPPRTPCGDLGSRFATYWPVRRIGPSVDILRGFLNFCRMSGDCLARAGL